MPDRAERESKSEGYAQLEALVGKVIQGDSEAFCDLCSKIVGSVLYQVSCLLSKDEDVEDVAQEVMLKVCKNIGSLSEPKAFKKWLSIIIVNEKNTYLTKKLKRGVVVDVDEYLERLLETRSEHMPIANFENAELHKAIKDLIDNLPERQKEAVVLRYYSELSLAEVAEVMGITPQTASQYIVLASKKIRRELEEHPIAYEQKFSALAAMPVGVALTEVLQSGEAAYAMTSGVAAQNILAKCGEYILAEAAGAAATVVETAYVVTTAETATATTAAVAKAGVSHAAIAYICVAALTVAAAVGVYLGGTFTENQPQPPPVSIVFYGGTDYGDEFARVNPERIYVATEEMDVQYWWITSADSDEILVRCSNESTVGSELARLKENGAHGEFLIHFRLHSEQWGHTVYQNFYIRSDG